MGYYVVRASDHLARIAHRAGVAPGDIWGHDRNRALREARGDGSILREGDLLFLPDPPAPQRETMQAGSRKTFQAQVARVPLRLRLARDGRALASEPYRIETPGEVIRGTSDGEGLIEANIRVTVGRVALVLEGRRERIWLDVGALDPVSDVTGLQMRLRHLGHYAGEITGSIDGATRAAIVRFQEASGIAQSGEADEPTLSQLASAHGS